MKRLTPKYRFLSFWTLIMTLFLSMWNYYYYTGDLPHGLTAEWSFLHRAAFCLALGLLFSLAGGLVILVVWSASDLAGGRKPSRRPRLRPRSKHTGKLRP